MFLTNYRYLLLATKKFLNIYSSATSLLVRRLEIDGGHIIGVKISPSNPNHVYIADPDGVVDLWDWTTAAKILSVTVNESIVGIDVVASNSSESDLLYMLAVGTVSKEVISYIYSCSIQDQKASSTSVIHQFNGNQKGIQVFKAGDVIVCVSDSAVNIGRISKAQQKAKELDSKIVHRWRELKCHEGIVCFDARFTAKPSRTSGASKKDPVSESMHLVLGSQRGKGLIYVYEDILKTLEDPTSIKGRKLHWHRNDVGSVKWSQDGKKSGK
jgi:NET1-associated nuclear protein 1 (U3 small nucleolar RNA-associated protein 17)